MTKRTMALPRIVTEELGGTPLARAAQRGDLERWYRPRPIGAAAWREYAREVAAPHETRTWLGELLPAFEPSGAAARRLRRSAEGQGVVVSTGQQAALFGGPLYTLLKALSALALADALERETAIPVAPVFWAATDDADFDEACCAKVAVGHEVRTLRIAPPPTPNIPMSAVPIPDADALYAALATACGSVADDAPLAAARESHRTGKSLGDAYVRFLRLLLEPLGIAVLDASHPAVRAAGGAVLARALERAPAIETALRARTDALARAGFTQQVDPVAGLSLVFSASPGQEKRRIPVTEARNAAQRSPQTLAPNVLLRPLLERSILPSAAYLGGPGEIAYFAQVSAVAEALELPTPLVLPRWSATIVEPRIDRLLTRLGVSQEELANPGAVESRLARAALPGEIAEAMERLRRDVDSDVALLSRADSAGLAPTASVEGLRRWVLRRIERLERRYLAGIKRRESQLMRDVATARAALFPEGSRQERVLNFVPFLARNGRPLLDAMQRAAERHAEMLLAAPAPARDASDHTVAERV